MFGWGSGRSTFLQHYRVFPCSFIEKPENGNKVYLPPSALNRLAQLHIEYPMLFKAENRRNSKYTHCGVLEFIADEGSVYVPYWMMKMLGLSEGDVLTLSNVSLPKGSYVKLQPHSTAFLDIANPRAVLERTLRNFSCLTTGDTVSIPYNDVVYDINVLETKPSAAVSVVETDVNVDFAAPLDYVEPTGAGVGSSAGVAEAKAGKAVAEPEASGAEGASAQQQEAENRFTAFQGSARRLDGKASAAVSAAPPAPAVVAGPPAPARKKSGKLMFKDRLAAKFEQAGGVASGGVAKKPEKKSEDEAEKEKEKEKEKASGFKAFEGRSYSLK